MSIKPLSNSSARHSHRPAKPPHSPASPLFTLQTNTPDSDDDFGRWNASPDLSMQKDEERSVKTEGQRMKTANSAVRKTTWPGSPRFMPGSVSSRRVQQRQTQLPRPGVISVKTIGFRPATKAPLPNPIRTKAKAKSPLLSLLYIPMRSGHRHTTQTQTEPAEKPSNCVSPRTCISPQFRLYEPDLKRPLVHVLSMPSMPRSLRLRRPAEDSRFVNFGLMANARFI